MGTRYLAALKGFLNRSTPGYLVFFVTPQCNCRCKMCFNTRAIEEAASHDTLRLDEIERIARRFPGLHHVNFSGGEPFLREDFAEIPSLFYAHSGTRFFACPTNSSRPERIEEALRTICTRCPDAWIRLTQSLDGVGDVHDGIRGFPGLFDRVGELNRRLAALRRTCPNLSVGVAMVMSRFNQGHEFELLDYVYRNLDFDDFGALYVRGETRDPDAASIKREAYLRFQMECLRRGRSHKRRTGFGSRLFAAIGHTTSQLVMKTVREDRFVTPCLAGMRMVVMDDEGNIDPCEMLGVYLKQGQTPLSSARLGNVRDFDYDIRAILASDQARRAVRYIRDSRCHCTFECAMSVNVLYSVRLWPRVLVNFLRI